MSSNPRRSACPVLFCLLMALTACPLTARAQNTLTGSAVIEVPADEIYDRLDQHQTRLDAAQQEREALRSAVERLAATPPATAPVLGQPVAPAPPAAETPVAATNPAPAVPVIPDPPTPPASLEGFTPRVRSRDTRITYVAADGNDRNHGRTPDAPLRTARVAYERLGDGRADHLLFKAGDVFTGEAARLGELTRSGRSADEPFVIGVYGPPEAGRPVFLLDAGGDGGGGGGGEFASSSFRLTSKHIVIQGLEFVAVRRDPSSPNFDPTAEDFPWRQGGIGLLGNDENILIQDCVFRYFAVALVVQSDEGHGLMRNIRLHRNIVVDSYSHHDRHLGGHSQALYAQGVDGLLIQENVFDHNGWHPAVDGAGRTKFNHNLYVQTDCRNVAVRDNLITRGASHGLQLRPGGEITGNAFIANALAAFTGWHHSTVTGNLFLKSDNIGPPGTTEGEPRGMGLEIKPAYRATVTDNLFAQKRGAAEFGRALDVNWDRHYLKHLDGAPFELILVNNKVTDWPVTEQHAPTIQINPVAEVLVNTGNAIDDPAWSDPTRDAARYAGEVLGLEPNFEAYIDQARARPRGTWDQALAAPALIRWVAEGFTAGP